MKSIQPEIKSLFITFVCTVCNCVCHGSAGEWQQGRNPCVEAGKAGSRQAWGTGIPPPHLIFAYQIIDLHQIVFTFSYQPPKYNWFFINICVLFPEKLVKMLKISCLICPFIRINRKSGWCLFWAPETQPSSKFHGNLLSWLNTARVMIESENRWESGEEGQVTAGQEGLAAFFWEVFLRSENVSGHVDREDRGCDCTSHNKREANSAIHAKQFNCQQKKKNFHI